MSQAIPFGKYLLLDRISVGGMAEVFKAKSYGVEGFEKIIAIKRILPPMGDDREFIKMFIDEAKIVGQLSHTNICQLFELGRTDGSHFIAMEYIWGKDLLQVQNRLRKLRLPMPMAMACFLVAKVCEGLDYAHKKRDALGRPLEIVHRDCSPQNILLSYEGEVKLIDFGIAKAASSTARTQAGVLKGKFGYMSPEQVRCQPLDRRSDVFAVGTILYECLSGSRLFVGETDFATLERVRNADVPPLRSVNAAIPEEIERIAMKALARDPADRFQWCGEIAAELHRYLMTQYQVFSAKTLATWLRDAFAADWERERQQLEQFKRIGRDESLERRGQVQSKPGSVESHADEGRADDPTRIDPSLSESFRERNEVAPRDRRPAGWPDGDVRPEFAEEAPTAIFGEISVVDAAREQPSTGPTAEIVRSGRPAAAPPMRAAPGTTGDARVAEPGAHPVPRPGEPYLPRGTSSRSSSQADAAASARGSDLSFPGPARLPADAMHGGATGAAPSPRMSAMLRASMDMLPATPSSVDAGWGGATEADEPAVASVISPVGSIDAATKAMRGRAASSPRPTASSRGVGDASSAPAVGDEAIAAPPSSPAMRLPPMSDFGAAPPSSPAMRLPPIGNAPAVDELSGEQALLALASTPVAAPPLAPLRNRPAGSSPPYPDGGPLRAPGEPDGTDGAVHAGARPVVPATELAGRPGSGLTRKTRGTSSWPKDVAIGVVMAGGILVAVAITKYVVGSGDHGSPASQVQTASLEIKVADGGAADVFLNGVKQGVVTRGTISLAGIAPGRYHMQVTRMGASSCDATIRLDAGETAMFGCALTAVAAPSPPPEGTASGSEAVEGGGTAAAGSPPRVTDGGAGAAVVGSPPRVAEAASAEEAVTRTALAPSPLVDTAPRLASPGSSGAAATREELVATAEATARSAVASHPTAPGASRSDERSPRQPPITGAPTAPGASRSDERSPRQPPITAAPTPAPRATSRSVESFSRQTASPAAPQPTARGAIGAVSASRPGKGRPAPVGGAASSPRPASLAASKLAKARLDPATQLGYLTVYATPTAKVSVDGEPTGQSTPITPMTKLGLTPGIHKVTFIVGRETFTFSVKINAGKTAKLSRDLPLPNSPTAH